MTTWVSQYQKNKTILGLNEAKDGVLGCSGISWTICKQSAPRSRQLTTPTPHHFRPDALPDAQPTVSKHRLSISCGFTSHLTQNSSLWRRFPKPNSWLGMKKQNLTQQKHAFTNQTKCTTTQTHTHTHLLNSHFSGTPGWAGTRKVQPIWISLKQETVRGSGISGSTSVERRQWSAS